jgi:hypothetical protein
VLLRGPPLWSSGQSSWLQFRRPGFDSRHYHKKVVCLERGPLSLVSTTEELLDRKVTAPVQKTENTAVGIRHADHVAPSIRKSWQTSPTSGGRSVGIVRSRTQAMEFSLVLVVTWRILSSAICHSGIGLNGALLLDWLIFLFYFTFRPED